MEWGEFWATEERGEGRTEGGREREDSCVGYVLGCILVGVGLDLVFVCGREFYRIFYRTS